MFKGSLVALVTPMKRNGAIDRKAFSALIHWHLEAGTEALVINGTTGESPTVSFCEQLDLLKWALEITADRVPIIAGTGSCSTQETIRRTQAAHTLGVKACLLVTPYYNKPTQSGLFEHYQAISNAVEIPIILYNVPSRTSCDLLPETVGRLSKIENIIGIKEATGDIARLKALQAVCDPNFYYYSGDDLSSLAFMRAGGQGVISVTANVAPNEMYQFCACFLEDKIHLAKKHNDRLMPLHRALFVETNPIPVKWALSRLGFMEQGIRLPLTPLTSSLQIQVEEAMLKAGILEGVEK